MGKWLEAAKAVRRTMDAAGGMLDDRQASTVVTLYPSLRGDGSLVTAGTRICWNGRLLRAAVDLWDSAENAPDAAASLWEEIAYREGYRVIPDTLTAGTAFQRDELGWWGDTLYQSLIDANVWTPEQNAEGWEAVENEADETK